MVCTPGDEARVRRHDEASVSQLYVTGFNFHTAANPSLLSSGTMLVLRRASELQEREVVVGLM